MKQSETEPRSVWQKTPYANLVQYVPSGRYYARVRVRGKLKRKCLNTDRITVAKLRLADFEKSERTAAENECSTNDGRMPFGEAVEIYRQRVKGDASLKPRTKDYHEQRITALLKSWPEIETTELRKLTKTDCLNWAAKFGTHASPSVFNHTISLLRRVIEIGVEIGVRYDNPARFIKRVRERAKRLQLPTVEQFDKFLAELDRAGGRFSSDCADLVRFLAYGGFRKMEASYITWADCDFQRSMIVVRGDPLTGTKNGEMREVPMIPEMAKQLEILRAQAGARRANSQVMAIRECQKAMDRAAKRVGMARITHHDLRHLFATRCIESGVDIPTVSRWLGHKDGGALAMRVYGHLRHEHSVEMAQKVSFSAGTTTKAKS